jgi:hypothetical protein
MPALGAGIHVLLSLREKKPWMAGTSPAMTNGNQIPSKITRLPRALFSRSPMMFW